MTVKEKMTTVDPFGGVLAKKEKMMMVKDKMATVLTPFGARVKRIATEKQTTIDCDIFKLLLV